LVTKKKRKLISKILKKKPLKPIIGIGRLEIHKNGMLYLKIMIKFLVSVNLKWEHTVIKIG